MSVSLCEHIYTDAFEYVDESDSQQAARAQTLTKRKAIGMKDVVARVKDRGLKEDMVLLTTKVVPNGESAAELVQYVSQYLVNIFHMYCDIH